MCSRLKSVRFFFLLRHSDLFPLSINRLSIKSSGASWQKNNKEGKRKIGKKDFGKLRHARTTILQFPPPTQARSTISPPGKEDHYYNNHGRLISHFFREGKICEISQQKIATARDYGSRVLFFLNSTTAEKPQTYYSFFIPSTCSQKMNDESRKFQVWRGEKEREKRLGFHVVHVSQKK